MAKLNDRTLKVGDECAYVSVIYNGTGMTYGDCTITAVVDKKNKIYELTEKGEKPRIWEVQDIDHEDAMKKAVKNLARITWIKVWETDV